MSLYEDITSGHTAVDKTPAGDPGTPNAHERTPRRRLNFGLDRYSGLYVWAILIIVFSLWVPDLFATAQNFRIIASSQAVAAIVALGLLIPVACGVFDLSIAGSLAVSETLVIYMQANHHSTFLGIVCGLVAGLLVGLVNSFVVIK